MPIRCQPDKIWGSVQVTALAASFSHIMPLNEPHLRRLIGEYLVYHHQDRIHDALQKDTPNRESTF
jgi:hypothetical protein